ncbi:putative membrane protein [Planktotalea frisia]|jgi:uncharacterized membrane protein|uniref:DUF599 domain-containing protein n=1 Tax=Planktotalea frisia TaxID=696762 RepID=A0A1L9NXX2_9RHOB|nr:DUF599 domain-containing protein [Planktotalea frisia]OJI94109.1 hypothetical protein PFRI_16390 [Planktotalea frisia]PZX29582.1 putative membrane protein [Planktotalea frisia]
MDILDRLALFSYLDYSAIGLLFMLWLMIGWRIEHPSKKHASVSVLMAEYRREWMRQMVTREPRIYDAAILASLRQGTAFFASASLISIGGVLALIGNTDQLIGIADDLTLDRDPSIVWELKLLVTLFFVTNAFLKFVWSNRLFGYCAVLMSAVPNDITDPRTMPRAMQAAEINVTAARGFNRGLRSVYFGLASVAWLAGPIALIGASLITCLVLWRREFASQSRDVLLSGDAHGA